MSNAQEEIGIVLGGGGVKAAGGGQIGKGMGWGQPTSTHGPSSRSPSHSHSHSHSHSYSQPHNELSKNKSLHKSSHSVSGAEDRLGLDVERVKVEIELKDEDEGEGLEMRTNANWASASGSPDEVNELDHGEEGRPIHQYHQSPLSPQHPTPLPPSFPLGAPQNLNTFTPFHSPPPNFFTQPPPSPQKQHRPSPPRPYYPPLLPPLHPLQFSPLPPSAFPILPSPQVIFGTPPPLHFQSPPPPPHYPQFIPLSPYSYGGYPSTIAPFPMAASHGLSSYPSNSSLGEAFGLTRYSSMGSMKQGGGISKNAEGGGEVGGGGVPFPAQQEPTPQPTSVAPPTPHIDPLIVSDNLSSISNDLGNNFTTSPGPLSSYKSLYVPSSPKKASFPSPHLHNPPQSKPEPESQCDCPHCHRTLFCQISPCGCRLCRECYGSTLRTGTVEESPSKDGLRRKRKFVCFNCKAASYVALPLKSMKFTGESGNEKKEMTNGSVRKATSMSSFNSTTTWDSATDTEGTEASSEEGGGLNHKFSKMSLAGAGGMDTIEEQIRPSTPPPSDTSSDQIFSVFIPSPKKSTPARNATPSLRNSASEPNFQSITPLSFFPPSPVPPSYLTSRTSDSVVALTHMGSSMSDEDTLKIIRAIGSQRWLDPRGPLKDPNQAYQMKEHRWPVIKIENIPFDTREKDIENWLPEDCYPPYDECPHPIHIILHRSTGRTLPHAYVEIKSLAVALEIINEHDYNQLGDRTARVKWERIGELVRDLFSQDEYYTTFGPTGNQKNLPNPPNGVLLLEENCILKDVELEALFDYCRRLTYSRDCCLERPFSSLASLVSKFPFSTPSIYNETTRQGLYRCLYLAIALAMRFSQETIEYTALYMKLQMVARSCPGFTAEEKAALELVEPFKGDTQTISTGLTAIPRASYSPAKSTAPSSPKKLASPSKISQKPQGTPSRKSSRTLFGSFGDMVIPTSHSTPERPLSSSPFRGKFGPPPPPVFKSGGCSGLRLQQSSPSLRTYGTIARTLEDQFSVATSVSSDGGELRKIESEGNLKSGSPSSGRKSAVSPRRPSRSHLNRGPVTFATAGPPPLSSSNPADGTSSSKSLKGPFKFMSSTTEEIEMDDFPLLDYSPPKSPSKKEL